MVRVVKVLAVIVGALALFVFGGCATMNYDAIRGAVDVSNGVAQLEYAAAPEVHARCVAPMQLIAAEDPALPGHTDRAKALAKTCDPIVESYDGTRKAHLLVLAAIAQAETGQITIGAVFKLVEDLTGAAAAFEKELTR